MQIDYNFTKRILNTMEKQKSHYISVSTLISESKPEYEDIDKDEYIDLFYGHLHLLKDTGIIEEVLGQNLGIKYSLNNQLSINGCYIRLTSRGYDFLKVLSKDGFIEKFKKCTITECIKIGEAVISNGITSYINNMF